MSPKSPEGIVVNRRLSREFEEIKTPGERVEYLHGIAVWELEQLNERLKTYNLEVNDPQNPFSPNYSIGLPSDSSEKLRIKISDKVDSILGRRYWGIFFNVEDPSGSLTKEAIELPGYKFEYDFNEYGETKRVPIVLVDIEQVKRNRTSYKEFYPGALIYSGLINLVTFVNELYPASFCHITDVNDQLRVLNVLSEASQAVRLGLARLGNGNKE
ncbi:hypothetical protein JW962_02075 [Candidatus Dojkabacteria bacterium]|nr:hypothetical protein [Candidatus Dojkabacteria bacterium]